MIGEMMGWMPKLRRLVIKVESIPGPAMRLPLLALIQKACEKTPTHREFCSLLRDNRLRFPALKNLEIWRVQLEGLYWLAPRLQEIREDVAKQSEQASFTRL